MLFKEKCVERWTMNDTPPQSLLHVVNTCHVNQWFKFKVIVIIYNEKCFKIQNSCFFEEFN
jgi:hypothetical protein